MKLHFQILLSVCLFFLSTAFVKAQGNTPALRHVQGISSIGVSGGYVTNGFNVGLGYTYYVKSRLMLRCKALYEGTTINSTKMSFVYLNPEILYSFIKVGNALYFNLKGGPLVGFENIKNSLMSEKKSAVVFGGQLGLNAECLLSNSIGLNLDYDQRFIVNSNAGSQSYSIMIGLVFFF